MNHGLHSEPGTEPKSSERCHRPWGDVRGSILDMADPHALPVTVRGPLANSLTCWRLQGPGLPGEWKMSEANKEKKENKRVE